MFTKHSNKGRDWRSSKGNNTIVAQTDYYTDYMAVAAAISKEVGTEVVYTSKRAINRDSFVDFLRILRRRNGQRRLALFMDNLAVHKAKPVVEAMEKLNIEPIWNAVYSPQFNPIEMSFSKLKLLYKKDRLERLTKKKPLPMDSMIRRAFSKVTKENISNYVEHCYRLLRHAS